jgi:hypothetical protein
MLIEKLDNGSYKVCLAFEYMKTNTGVLIDHRALAKVITQGCLTKMEYGHPGHDMCSVPSEEYQYLSSREKSNLFNSINEERVCAELSNIQIEEFYCTRKILTAILTPTGPFADKVHEHVKRTGELKVAIRLMQNQDFATDIIGWDIIDNDRDVCLSYMGLKAIDFVSIEKYWKYRLSNDPVTTFDSISDESQVKD